MPPSTPPSLVGQDNRRLFHVLLTLFPLIKPAFTPLSRDEDVYIFKESNITTVAQLIVTWLLIVLIIVPVIVVQTIERVALQILCSMIGSGIFIFVLSSLVRARMAELFVAGAT